MIINIQAILGNGFKQKLINSKLYKSKRLTDNHQFLMIAFKIVNFFYYLLMIIKLKTVLAIN